MFRKPDDGRFFVNEQAEREPVLGEVTTCSHVSRLHGHDGTGRWKQLRLLSSGEVMHAFIRAVQDGEAAAIESAPQETYRE